MQQLNNRQLATSIDTHVLLGNSKQAAPPLDSQSFVVQKSMEPCGMGSIFASRRMAKQLQEAFRKLCE